MKKRELMIGDWAKFNSGYGKVTGITDVGVHFVDRFGGGIASGADPIPLTPEILEKNGLKKVQKNFWQWERKAHTNTDIMYCDDIIGFGKEFPSKENGGLNTGGWLRVGSSRGVIDVQCDFVHELQHALRLCGIQKEIVL